MSAERTIALVGQPNVGKSVIMNYFTGVHAFVSNYPGTTVEITEGEAMLDSKKVRIIDTPGTYTLHSDTEEQKITQRILTGGPIDVVVNIVDATDLARNLYFTLQIIDLGIPMVVALNQIDRARRLGLEIDIVKLERELGVPVIPTTATTGEGMEELRVAILNHPQVGKPMQFSNLVEGVIARLGEEIKKQVTNKMGHPFRALAIHLLEHDQIDEELCLYYPGFKELIENLQHKMGQKESICPDCFRGCAFCPASDKSHPILLTCIERTLKARQIAQLVTTQHHRKGETLGEKLEQIIDQPLSGLPILLVLAYLLFNLVILGIRWAETLITAIIDPILKATTHFLGNLLPTGIIRSILVNAIPEGLLIPFTIVMPAMLAVYLLIAILEDTGLLSRFAVALNRFTSLIGLEGQAVIPFLLGFGCRVPALIATRILPDTRQRLIACTLLAIVIPCGATIAIATGVIAKFQANVAVIVVTLVFFFFLIGALLGRFLKGNPPELVLEVPPLRIPAIKNVAYKTGMRMRGFFTHVLPILLAASMGVRAIIETGAIDNLAKFSHFTQIIFGIRGEAFVGVVLTAVQRYLAPAVLLNLPLTAREATIGLTMSMLSFPCLPFTIIALKELGWRQFIKIFAIAIFVPVIVGIILNLILP